MGIVDCTHSCFGAATETCEIVRQHFSNGRSVMADRALVRQVVAPSVWEKCCDSRHIVLDDAYPALRGSRVYSTISGEPQALREGRWRLEFAPTEGGEAFVYNELEAEPLPVFVDDLSQRSVWFDVAAVHGPRYGVMGRNGCVEALSDLQRKFLLRSLSCRLPPTAAEVQIDCMVFNAPRGGLRVFLSLPDIHKVARLSMYGSDHRLWCRHQWRAWSNALSAVGACPSDHMVMPRPRGGVEADPDHLGEYQSGSLFMVLLILASGASGCRAQGGFKDESDRAGAETVLRGLLSIADTRNIQVQVVDSAAQSLPALPLPRRPEGVPIVSLEAHDGWVCISPLLGVQGRASVLATQWAQVILGSDGDGDFVPLYDFVVRVAQRSTLPVSARAFVLLQIAQALDSVMLEAVLGRLPGEVGLVALDAALDTTERRLQLKLAGYMYAARNVVAEQFQTVPHISITLDESNVRGLQLCLGAAVLPSNHAIWCPPQA